MLKSQPRPLLTILAKQKKPKHQDSSLTLGTFIPALSQLLIPLLKHCFAHSPNSQPNLPSQKRLQVLQKGVLKTETALTHKYKSHSPLLFTRSRLLTLKLDKVLNFSGKTQWDTEEHKD